MRRILVIKNVSLWIALNRHFSSVSSVDLVETPSFETGRMLAQVDRPDVIACSAQADEIEELLRELRDADAASTRIVCVRDRDVREPSTLPSDPAIVRCDPDDLIETVSALIDFSDDAADGESFELLSHYEILSGPPGEPRRGFAILLELDEHRLLMESDHPFDVADAVLLNFFLNAAAGGSEREKVTLTCEVQECVSEDKLVYAARVTKIDESSELAVRRLSSGSGRRWS